MVKQISEFVLDGQLVEVSVIIKSVFNGMPEELVFQKRVELFESVQQQWFCIEGRLFVESVEEHLGVDLEGEECRGEVVHMVEHIH